MNDSPLLPLSEIAQIAVTFADVPRAVAFYRDVLGLRFLFEAGPNLAFLAAGEVRLMFSTPNGAGTPGQNSILYFRVADLAAAYAQIIGRGASPAQEPHLIAKMPDHELWLAGVRDPEGNFVGLLHEHRP